MPSRFNNSPRPLLHIDDNPHDRLLVQEAIRTANVPFEFHGVAGVQAGVDYFLRSAIENVFPLAPGQCGHPRPALVLLDYHLGQRCGTDFLYWLRTLHRNTAIPVVMYSGSSEREHIGECYARGANHFLSKAGSFMRTKAIVQALHACFSLPTLSFRFLGRLPESEPDPHVAELVVA